MSLVERIRRGEAAIAAAKAEGRNVAEWEEHLEKLRHEAELQQAEQLAGAVLAENQPDEVSQILAVWRRLFNIDLEAVRQQDNGLPENIKTVAAHLAFIRKVSRE
jgi:uncharacterized protein YmfQ (DUF2313 family)